MTFSPPVFFGWNLQKQFTEVKMVPKAFASTAESMTLLFMSLQFQHNVQPVFKSVVPLGESRSNKVTLLMTV